MYHSGQGVPRDYEKAMQWFRKAADQGFAAAQYNLGFVYQVGLGDNAEAVRWYKRPLTGVSCSSVPSRLHVSQRPRYGAVWQQTCGVA